MTQVRTLREDAEKSARDQSAMQKLANAKQAEDMQKMQTQFNAYSTAQHTYTSTETRSVVCHWEVATCVSNMSNFYTLPLCWAMNQT